MVMVKLPESPLPWPTIYHLKIYAPDAGLILHQGIVLVLHLPKLPFKRPTGNCLRSGIYIFIQRGSVEDENFHAASLVFPFTKSRIALMRVGVNRIIS